MIIPVIITIIIQCTLDLFMHISFTVINVIKCKSFRYTCHAFTVQKTTASAESSKIRPPITL